MNLNLTYALYLSWLLCFTPHDAGANVFEDANDTVPPERTSAELHTYPNQDNFGKLEGGGKLLAQELDPHWLSTLVYFPHGGKHGIMLRNNLTAINTFLAAEVRRPATVRTFLKKHLLVFLDDTLASDGSFPITPTPDGDHGVITNAEGVGLPSSSPASKRLQKKIRPYEQPYEVVITGNAWTVDINVVTNHGAAEHWLVRGKARPLRVDSFLCEPKEPAGTFRRALHNGG